MFDLDTFIKRGHEKVIDHYSRLRNSARSESERRALQRRIDSEMGALTRHLEQHGRQRAA